MIKRGDNVVNDIWQGWVGVWKSFLGKGKVGVKVEKNGGKMQNSAKLENQLKTEVRPGNAPPKRANLENNDYVNKTSLSQIKKDPAVKSESDPIKPFKIEESYIENPKERLERVARQAKKKERVETRSAKCRQMLFLNPSSESIKLALSAFKGGLSLPKAIPFQKELTFDRKRLYFEGKPMLLGPEKRLLVKKEYFDPKGFATIRPIYGKFKEQYANVTRADVTRILRTFETYQLNFARRHPPKVTSRMNLKNPGVILLDTFFPSKNAGWREDLAGVLTCMDAWSRYVRCYALTSKRKRTVQKGIEKFLREFASVGHLPKIILSDKGSELTGAKDAIEPYRTKPGKMVFHSQTGKPVNLVEQTQAQIQRRLQVFRTSGITDDYSTIIDDICDSINNQKRPGRGDLTPIELLALDKAGRERVNVNSRFGVSTADVSGKPLYPGSHVRVLMMTQKEQVTGKKKGFSEKWSRDVYIVRRKTSLQGNPEHYRYFLHDDSESYFRHELLSVPRFLDTEIIDMVVHRENVIEDPDDEWRPDSD